MSKQKCPTCGKSFQRLQQHIDMAHGGKQIGRNSSSSADGSYGGTIGRGTPQNIGSLVKKRGRAQVSSRNLWIEDEQRYVQVLRNGVPVVRKVGDRVFYDPTEGQ